MPTFVQLNATDPADVPVVLNPEGVDALVQDAPGSVAVHLRGGGTVIVEGTVERVARTLAGRSTLRHQRGADDA